MVMFMINCRWTFQKQSPFRALDSLKYPMIAAHEILTVDSKQDMQELLNNPQYFQAYLSTLRPFIQMQEERKAALQANVAATGEQPFALGDRPYLSDEWPEQNMALQPELEALRSEAARTFNEAHELKDRFAALEAHQQHAAQVLPNHCFP